MTHSTFKNDDLICKQRKFDPRSSEGKLKPRTHRERGGEETCVRSRDQMTKQSYTSPGPQVQFTFVLESCKGGHDRERPFISTPHHFSL
jgi:hypothetical protein